MKQETIKSIQEWLPITQILENGIIKLKEDNYIKIIKIIRNMKIMKYLSTGVKIRSS